MSNAMRPDAQAFDEVRIITIPRYKESGLSGDEWRISAETRFYRKGAHIFSIFHRNVETACGFAYGDFLKGIDEGKAYFAGDGKICDQEGCNNLVTVKYRLRKFFLVKGTNQYRILKRIAIFVMNIKFVGIVHLKIQIEIMSL